MPRLPPYEKPRNVVPETTVHPRRLTPSLPPPKTALPPLPTPPRSQAFTHAYTLTTHIVPAAFPRAPSSLPPFENIPSEETKDERKARVSRTALAVSQNKWAHEAGKNRGEVRGEVLWHSVNRYVRNDINDRSPGVTLFLTHANGFHKEIWEEMLKHLFRKAEESNVKVDEVWAFEMVNHGDSATINQGKLGDLFDWADNARDILNFVLHYMPDKATAPSISLPLHLPRVAEEVAEIRKVHGFRHRTLVGLGHSIGACTLVYAAVTTPAPFSSLLLVDPVICPPSRAPPNTINPLVPGALARRSTWGTREEAHEALKNNPFFAAWDPSVLQAYIEFGIREDDHGGVRLKMSGYDEAVVFTERQTPCEVWELLPNVDESIEMRWIMAAVGGAMSGGPEATAETVWRREKNSSNTRFSCGHLVVQELPRELAEDVFAFLERKYGKGRARL